MIAHPSPSGEGTEVGSDSSHPTSDTPLPTLPQKRERVIVLAAISGAHGVTGEVRLKLFAENAASVKRHKAFNDGALTLSSLRPTKDGAIARFAEITDRNMAEKLRSTLLTVQREALPPLGKDEYYHADLLGLPCVSTDGTDLGTCVAVENFGAGDVLEIQLPPEDGRPGKKFMVPMNVKAVPRWGDEADGLIVIDAAFVV